MTPARSADLAINPTAYQRTHKLAMAAHSAALRIAESALKLEQDMSSLQKDNSDLWKRVNLATVRNDELRAIVDRQEREAQNLRVIATACVGVSVLSLVFAFAALFIG